MVTATYAQFVGEYFQGQDTWAHIWTSLDTFRVLTSPIMAGTSFPDAWARFYRPVSSLSYALDYAVAGLNPVVFHLTDLLLHLAATFGLYSLAVVFGLRPWAAAVGGATFALHPIMASVVPDVPRRHDPLAMTFLLGALTLVAWGVSRDSRSGQIRAGIVAGSLCLLAAAELAKEIAYVGVVLVGPTMVVAAWSAGVGVARRHVLTTVGAWGGVSLALFVWRWHVIGDIVGGYNEHMAPFFNLDVALNDILRNVLWPFRSVLQTNLRAWLTEIGLAVFVAGVPCLFVRRAACATLLYGWLWLTAFGLFQGLSHTQAPWHTYFTVAGIGFLAAAVLDGATEAWQSHMSPWLRSAALRAGARSILAGCVAGVLVFEVAALRDSALLTRYTGWHITAELGRRYLAAIQPCLQATPAGLPVLLEDYPAGLDDSTDQFVLVQAGTFAPYALGPAVHLVTGQTGLRVLDSDSGLTFSSQPRALRTHCAERDGVWRIDTTYDRAPG